VANLKDSAWLWTMVFLGFPALVFALMLWMVGEVTGLLAQAAVVVGGFILLVAGWRLIDLFTRHGATSDETPERPYVRPRGDVYLGIAICIWIGAKSAIGLSEYDAGDRWWWWAVIGLPMGCAGLIYYVLDLYRHRDVHAREREEKWDPWG